MDQSEKEKANLSLIGLSIAENSKFWPLRGWLTDDYSTIIIIIIIIMTIVPMLSEARLGVGRGQRGRWDRDAAAAARGPDAGIGSGVSQVRTTLKGEIETERYWEHSARIS